MITEECVAETKHIDEVYQLITEGFSKLEKYTKPFYGPTLLGNPEVDIIDKELTDINDLWKEYMAAHKKLCM